MSSEGLGRGTTFSVELPVYEPRDRSSLISAVQSPRAQSASSTAAITTSSYSISPQSPPLPPPPLPPPPLPPPPPPRAASARVPMFVPCDSGAKLYASIQGERDESPALQSAVTAIWRETVQSAVTAPSVASNVASNVIASSNTVAPSQQISSAVSAIRTSRFAALFPRILLVDDAASNRKMLRRLLTAKGFSCEEAVDGTDALKVFARHRAQGDNFSTILMDFEMPEMNGPTATKELRTKLGCTCPIFGVTGNVLPHDVEHFLEQGANKILAKPLNINALEQAWDELASGAGTNVK